LNIDTYTTRLRTAHLEHHTSNIYCRNSASYIYILYPGTMGFELK